ncbi:hypothetical protein [Kitasatospora phosalacinea]|uniref:hypothetical protein n=1 Tax=Kitasatospora phosalacinea TaxID=2065 RepID=UPI0005276BCE|nr:hypothetical protein [Kitasatospora phosalacinea]
MSTEPADAAVAGTAAAEPSAAPPVPTAAPAPAPPLGVPPLGVLDLIKAGGEPTRARRRFGAGALFLTAVLAGPVVGAAVGYAIQSSRPPTPLPKITAPRLSYSAERVDPEALAAAGPPPLAIDGDLRRLLIERPSGSTALSVGDGDGWLSPADRAEAFDDSVREFTGMLEDGFRRAATVRWSSGDDSFRVSLIQYNQDSVAKTITGAVPHSTTDMVVSKIPGNTDSYLMTSKKTYNYARSTETYYYGEALARKGTVLMTVQVFAKNPVDRAQLEDIAKRQWEKLA